MSQQLGDAPGFIIALDFSRPRRGCGIGQRDRQLLLLRRVADAIFRTALRGDLERQRQDAGHVALHRYADADLLVEHLDLAEGFIVFFLALGDLRRADLEEIRFEGEAEFVAVKVVARRNVEADFECLAIERTRARAEGLFGMKEISGQHRPDESGQGSKNEGKATEHGRVF